MPSSPNWLKTEVSNLLKQHQNGSLPHGLLVIGHTGDGRSLAITDLIDALICTGTSLFACGICKSCRLMASGHHPDLIKIEPEGKSFTIKIDTIRHASQHVAETAQQGGNKVVWIDGAETMNLNAANALLKVLEEPTPNTYIIIASEELSGTLPTVRSRCRIVKLPTPTMQQSLDYLSSQNIGIDPQSALGISYGRPINASKVTEQDISNWYACEQTFIETASFTELSRFIFKQPMTAVLKQVLMWAEVGIKSSNGLKLTHEPVSDKLLQILSNKSLVSLFRFRDFVIKKISAERRHANLNGQLVAEELASQWLVLRGNQ